MTLTRDMVPVAAWGDRAKLKVRKITASTVTFFFQLFLMAKEALSPLRHCSVGWSLICPWLALLPLGHSPGTATGPWCCPRPGLVAPVVPFLCTACSLHGNQRPAYAAIRVTGWRGAPMQRKDMNGRQTSSDLSTW